MKPRDKIGPTLDAARALVRRVPALRPDEPGDELTAERLERATVLVAFAMTSTGKAELAPLLEYLEAELARYRNAPDPLERARAILERHTTPSGK